MGSSEKKVISDLFEILKEHGVKNIVCSPGSRNAPLLLAVANDDDFKKSIIIDERSAAFHAMGISQVSQAPVALVCTSGSAVLNYAPAVAEAFYQGIPLIVLSADRPLEWIDQDDSQTINQFECLRNFVKRSYDIIADHDAEEYRWYVNRIVNEALLEATSGKQGPVHINIRINVPLARPAKDFREQRIVNLIQRDEKININILKELVETIATRKVLVVCGFMSPNHRLQKGFVKLLKMPNVVVMAETLSNLHLPEENYMIDSVLTKMTPEEKEAMKPDIVISMGGALISRFLKEYLREFNPEQHWHISYSENLIDCFKSLTTKIEVSPADFISRLSSKLEVRNKYRKIESDYSRKWNAKRKLALESDRRYIKDSAWSELKAFDRILNRLPEDVNLSFSNGTSIRYGQLISYRVPHASYCNRGVSGIEGSISTFIGGATQYKGRSLLITGDTSFSYDMTALFSRYCRSDMRIIVISNGGGGIFRFIRNTRDLPEREEYFCVDQNLPVEKIGETFGWESLTVKDTHALDKALDSFFDTSEKPRLMNVVCDAEESAEILKNYFTQHKQ